MKFKNKKLGFTLLETLVAISVFTVAVLGPLALATYSMRLASYGRNQITAYYLAEEAIEFSRKVRDTSELSGETNWLKAVHGEDEADLSKCFGAKECYLDAVQGVVAQCTPSPCPKVQYDTASGLYNHDVLGTNEESIFRRSLRVQKIGGSDYDGDGEEDEARLRVTIEWNEGAVERSLVLEGYIFNY